MNYPGIGRLAYAGVQALLFVFHAFAMGIFQIILRSDSADFTLATWLAIIYGVGMLCIYLWVLSLRLSNIGNDSFWWYALGLVPFLSFFLMMACVTLPAGYAQSKSLDNPARILLGCYGCLFLLFLTAFIYALAQT